MKQIIIASIMKELSGLTVGSSRTNTAEKPILHTNKEDSNAPPTRSASLKKAGKVLDLFASTSAMSVVMMMMNEVD